MKIIFERKFIKNLKKLSSENRKRVNTAIKIFEKDPFDSKLRNHKLFGRYEGLRSFSAAYDLRIIFREQDGYVTVMMINVGTHDEVY